MSELVKCTFPTKLVSRVLLGLSAVTFKLNGAPALTKDVVRLRIGCSPLLTQSCKALENSFCTINVY